MKLTLFRRQLMLTALIMITFMILGLITAFVVGRFESDRLRISPFSSFARLVDTVAEREKIPLAAALTDVVKQSRMEDDRFSFSIQTRSEIEASGFAKGESLPDKPYQALFIDKRIFGPPTGEIIQFQSAPDRFLVVRIQFSPPDNARSGLHEFVRMLMGPPDGGPMGGFNHPPGHFGPPGDHPPGFPPTDASGRPLGPPPGGEFFGHPPGEMGGMHGFNIFLVNFIALTVSVLLGSALSIFLLFYSLRDKARMADQILSAMQSGDLKKRFPITRLDEAGLMMQKFNKMADEIEHLVDKLKSTELARMRLLQELAHDLRTPVASLKNVLETLQLRIDVLTPEDKNELLSLSVKEIEYFENLVEDLLFLAQVTDPRYHAEKTGTDLMEVLDEELSGVEVRGRAGGSQVKIARDFAFETLNFSGDAHLLRRLFRNAFENAFSFARTKVEVKVALTEDGRGVRVLVRDDGPGLSEEALVAFGEKRGTRAFTKTVTGRFSVGLGSVIMKAVVQAHSGQLAISNRRSASGQVEGAELLLELN